MNDDIDLKREQAKADYKALMSTVQGRRVVGMIVRQCAVHEPSFNRDALVMAFNEGQRAVGIALLRDLRAICPEQVIVMDAEALAADQDAAVKRDAMAREADT